jgi:hypothetical protein
MNGHSYNLAITVLLFANTLRSPAAGDAPAALPENEVIPPGVTLPQWPKPLPAAPGHSSLVVRSKDLELEHSNAGLGNLVVRVAGRPFAISQNRPLFGYLVDGAIHWLDLGSETNRAFTLRSEGNAVGAHCECKDGDGATWQVNQRFAPGSIPSSINIQVEVTVNHDRSVVFLPMLMLFPGAGSFGPSKEQGLFAGLEYLENEPSSSEADVVGPASKRQVPDTLKITFPLMVIQNQGAYVALTWEMQPQYSAVFDSPDRLLNSGGHVMGLLFPGSNGENREEGNLLPRRSQLLHAGQTLTLHATLLGGRGSNVIPAVQQYITLAGLPALPSPAPDLSQYVALAAGGWLDSKIREGNLIRHAVAGGNFPPGQAADAALWMDWLSTQEKDATLSERLKSVANDVRSAVPAVNLNVAAVGHIRFPVESLVYGHVAESAAQAERSARALLGGFEPDGSCKYHPREGGPDYARTHFSNEANGFTSRAVLDLLEAASFCGNRELLDAGLQRLRGMSNFLNGVPRGAQTWECPLHTPDILASAQLVRAFTLGYELTGDSSLLDQARYWAWTGVPFVYLVNPVDKPIGPYATIAVFGATQWRAPVWLGLPVQWCGLVYADALYRLTRDDPKGPWKTLADGITVSGVQQSWPATHLELQGLLPDSFVLRSQKRNGPAINPATLQSCAVRYYGQRPIYDFHAFLKNSLRVHAPGLIQNATEKKGHVSFQVESWADHPYYVLVNGLTQTPRTKINRQQVECVPPHDFQPKEGRLVLQLEGKAQVEIDL